MSLARLVVCLLTLIFSKTWPHTVFSVCNPGIPAVFANSESRDWPRLNFCRVSNDTNNNSSPLMNKLFDTRYRVLVLLCNVICVLQSVNSLQLAIPSVRSAYYILMHEISLLWIPKQRPFYKPNPETGSRVAGITNFSIPGLQSLAVLTSLIDCD